MPTNNPHTHTNHVRFAFRQATKSDQFVSGLRRDFNVSEEDGAVELSADRKTVRVDLGQGDYQTLVDYAATYKGRIKP